LLKIYMDESGVHNSAPVVAVAGYISRSKHWRAWTKIGTRQISRSRSTTPPIVPTSTGKGERMAFVHEQNSYQADAQRAFAFVDQNLNPRGINMTIAFGTKKDHPPLQAADVLAYEGAKFLRNLANITPRRAWCALDPDKSRLIVRRYGPDNMGVLIKTLNDYRERLLEQGWDGKLTA
jgi:hypothetical protein